MRGGAGRGLPQAVTLVGVGVKPLRMVGEAVRRLQEGGAAPAASCGPVAAGSPWKCPVKGARGVRWRGFEPGWIIRGVVDNSVSGAAGETHCVSGSATWPARVSMPMHMAGPIQGPAGTILCAHALDPKRVVQAPAGLPEFLLARTAHRPEAEKPSPPACDMPDRCASRPAARSGGWSTTVKEARSAGQST